MLKNITKKWTYPWWGIFQVTVSQAAYLPFDLVSIALRAFQHIWYILDSTDVRLSQDLTLQNTIRKWVQEYSNLSNSIGTAQMEKEPQTIVLTIAKKTSNEMKENSRASHTEDDLVIIWTWLWTNSYERDYERTQNH